MTAEALNYFNPSPHNFWSWSSEFDAIEAVDGRCIWFYEELDRAIELLADHGLPPFPAIVILGMIARLGGSDLDGQIGWMSDLLDNSGDCRPPGNWRPELRFILANVGAALGNFDDKQRAVISLTRQICGKANPCKSLANSASIRKVLAAGEVEQFIRSIADGSTRTDDSRSAAEELVGAILVLINRLRERSANEIAHLIRTGIDDVPESPDIDEPEAPEPTSGEFLRDLSEDNDHRLASLGQLALQLQAAISLPLPPSDVEELPLGGFSDLSNRGPLDRLLISELAHDDDVLLTRLAMGEALYLRRETPPSPPQLGWTVLIDNGMRLWGAGKLFGFGVALAVRGWCEDRPDLGPMPRFVHPSRTDLEDALQSAPAAGQTVELADFEIHDRDALMAAISEQTTSLSPADLVDDLFELGSQERDVCDRIMIIAHPTSFTDPLFVEALEPFLDESPILAAVTRGGYQLIRATRGGRENIGGALVDFSTLLRTSQKAPRRTPTDSTFPAILSIFPMPLRVSVQPQNKQATSAEAFSADCGVIAVSSRGDLLHWDAHGLGARVICSGMPSKACVFSEIGVDGGLCVVLLFVAREELVLVSAPISRAGVDEVPDKLVTKLGISRAEYCGAILLPAGIVILCETRTLVVDPISGETLSATGPQHFDQLVSRYLYDSQTWWQVTIDGENHPVFHDCCADIDVSDVLAIVDYPSTNLTARVYVLTKSGQLSYAPGDGLADAFTRGTKPIVEKHHKGPPINGKHVIKVGSGAHSLSAKPVHFEIGRGEKLSDFVFNFQSLGKDPKSKIAPPVPDDFLTKSCPTVRHRFNLIGTDGNRLFLETPRNKIWEVTASPHGGISLTMIHRSDLSIGSEDWARLEDIEGPPGTKYVLRRAMWVSGETAFIDSRGMLHLMFADPAEPEVTLTICDKTLGGWTSEGFSFGNPFFGSEPTIKSTEGLAMVRRFATRASASTPVKFD